MDKLSTLCDEYEVYKEEQVTRTSISNMLYRPKLDVSDLCTPDERQFYQQVVGIKYWMIKIGHIDIVFGVSLMPC